MQMLLRDLPFFAVEVGEERDERLDSDGQRIAPGRVLLLTLPNNLCFSYIDNIGAPGNSIIKALSRPWSRSWHAEITLEVLSPAAQRLSVPQYRR